jgi:hypothetical protein
MQKKGSLIDKKYRQGVFQMGFSLKLDTPTLSRR